MSNVLDLKTNAICVICQDVWTDPQAINCSHIFCTGCLDTLTARQDPKCPLCNATIVFRMKLPQLSCLAETIVHYVEETKPSCVQARREDDYLVCWMPSWKNKRSLGAYSYLVDEYDRREASNKRVFKTTPRRWNRSQSSFGASAVVPDNTE